MPHNQRRRDYFKLHCIILLWGFTAVLGKLVELPSLEVVFIRSGIATLVLAVMLRSRLSIARNLPLPILANGALIGLHWVTFFASAKVANVSVCMVGMATISLWTALLEPILIRGRRIRWDELFFGAVLVAAVYWIFRGDAFQNDPNLPTGLLLSISSAIVAALFSIFNGMLATQADHRVIVAYEMAGASVFCGVVMILSAFSGWPNAAEYSMPTAIDWLWLVVLAVVCTVYAFSEYVELLNRLTVFTINFANNLEPIYGILLGALVFQDHEQVDFSFYAGAILIAVCVALQPWFGNARTRRRMSKPGTV
ncbi:Permease of the drug/metabolite transporter (DMT) superfamily [Neorhodopirellula lusitana]|uniref:Permease of the drug/metabolite transporter (DMT) superfamily n=1 Tax=Neorhodopirellula lusitana TaxID=445327 RepID=A0ABY1QA94_9BACT|nr:DMT family transporter [Neorhodopirellula lusitana]SMP65390.1 Permease of the drug/metabolite transporter (DMT) superfamily [Neorhodopirellula lusitana]